MTDNDRFAERPIMKNVESDVEMKDTANASVAVDVSMEKKSRDILELIQNLSKYLCSIEENGEELAAGFQRIPNRRILPDYFSIIREPVAFSTIRGKLQKKQYTTFTEFVRDVAQICHNAQVYNRPSAPIFSAAERLREIFQSELRRLEARGVISAQDAKLPNLGELPSAEESPSRGSEADAILSSEGGEMDENDNSDEGHEEDEEEDDDVDDNEEDNEGEDEEDRDEGDGHRCRKARKRLSAFGRATHLEQFDDDSPRKRGRPPIVLTPLEARISSVLKGLRKAKDRNGNLLIQAFEKLPDKSVIPDYYETISKPMAMDYIKKKAKRKNYRSLDQVMLDIELMFENAKLYNEDDSEVYRAAEELQREARVLAEQESAKPDDYFRDEDGKLALSEIFHNDQFWRVGDWVHIRNPNDLAKPIVAQIFKMWQDRAEQKWINVCWYYRPEQTVHRYEKHFYEHEVVKTGQYRDHHIGEVIDRCFVMFVTRFHKGRPRGFPPDKDVYVCESRYNEERFRFNKIKTWASCVPDETRDKDYEMDLFENPRQMRKVPSPIKHLLREDAKETDLPKPTWGSSNAPPIVGAVHRRPPEPNESPPPLSQPPPTSLPMVPGMLPESSHRTSILSGAKDGVTRILERDARGSFSGTSAAPPPSHHMHMTPAAPMPGAPPIHQTPVPIPHPAQQAAQSQVSIRPLQQQQSHHHQPVYSQGYPSNYAQPPAMPLHAQPTANPRAASYSQAHLAPTTRPSSAATPVASQLHPNIYNPPRPPEVYTLFENVNDALPLDVRQSFQHDSTGKVLFFTAAPLDRSTQGHSPANVGLGHSMQYLAGRNAWLEIRKKKRKERHDSTGDPLNQAEQSHRVSDGYAGDAVVSKPARCVEDWFQHLSAETDRWGNSVGLTGWKDPNRRESFA